MKPKLVSIFSGVGGLDFGFEKAGFETTFFNDNWLTACNSLKENFPGASIRCCSIEEVDFKEIKRQCGPIDGLLGGPPCPPFSKSRFYLKNKSRGIDDENGFITLSNYFRAVQELSPKFFFLENVHGFVFKPHASALDLLLSESERLGYKVFHSVVNAADYGVPQVRQRFVCIGVKLGMRDFEWPNTTHIDPKLKTAPDKTSWVDCGEAIGDLDFPLPEDNEMQAGSKHKDLLKLVPPGDNYLYFTEERGYPDPIFKWRSRYWSFLLKLSKERPSWTIQASHSNNMGPFHWTNRFLRIPEIKRLQSFDDSATVLGSFSEQWRQIGNAVPPMLAYTFAKSIKQQYFSKKLG
jgi:DNA (cytosine-5)-methyltransferase 1